MTTAPVKKICEGYEPIPGYVLEEVIGSGGFGEVWRASAPGGLKKAVKFVFGTTDQTRAERELRSLERIKGVQHPFLLTLERFEAIDDQLVIVTELADCSLEDVFRRNREHGSCGIAREVLISHLHDTADALDYLHQKYQLQHLDIKPANLLLVGDHVKVADFGLLKDLREAECSVVGGLTPTYAPPEIFDGRPSLHSDQYSLAVMYQELLTGTRPFSGRTIAQLATQHVHSAPNLEPLPPSDRPVVARALEKNPERRFPNCKAFVEALRNPRGRSTAVCSSGVELAAGDTKTSGGLHAAAVEDLPQLNSRGADAKKTNVRHAIVVALGGTGAECLRELRRRAADTHAACPLDLHSVLIDTDPSTIHSMRVGEISTRVTECMAIHTPLKTAHEYRKNGTERLSSVSRRWIYNVPRSGATEGMRPLGRLALVDHGPKVTEKLSKSISGLVEASGGHLPRVYVIGSLTGGTASGMYLDVVHLLRHLLDEAGLVEASILSMLSTATLQGQVVHPLALHDVQAAMIEIQHFLKAGNGYPGDGGAGWPSVPAARTPLRDVYVVAGSPDGTLVPPPAATIADYVWSDATEAGELLADARKLEIEQGTSIIPPSIRSVGVIPLGDSNRLERKVLAPAVVRNLLIQWLGLPSKAREDAVPLADRLMRRCGLTSEALLRETGEAVDEGDTRAKIDQAISVLSDEQLHSASAVSQRLGAVVESLASQRQIQVVVANIIKNVHREIAVGLNDERADVTTVIECLKRVNQQLTDISAHLAQDGLSEDSVQSPHAIAVRLIVNFQIEQLRSTFVSMQSRLDQFATTLAHAIVAASKANRAATDPWKDMPAEMQSEFAKVVSDLHAVSVNRYLIRSLSEQWANIDAITMVHQLVDVAVPRVTTVVERNRESFGGSAGDTCTSIPQECISLSESAVALESPTQTAVTQTMPSMTTDRDSDEPLTVEEAMVAVKPTLLAFGGRQRLILVVGNEQERSQLEPSVRDAHEGHLTVVLIPGATPKLIHEAQQIELKNILSRLTVLNGGNTQVTSRLSSRTDVAW